MAQAVAATLSHAPFLPVLQAIPSVLRWGAGRGGSARPGAVSCTRPHAAPLPLQCRCGWPSPSTPSSM